MYPTRRILRVSLLLKADAHSDYLTFVGARLNFVIKGDHPAAWTIEFDSLTSQGFQLCAHPINALRHCHSLAYATGVGASRSVMNTLSSDRFTQSSQP